MPLYFEDVEAFAENQELVSPARTVPEADVASLAAWTGDYNPVHTDAVAAAQGRFGEWIAHGALGPSLGIGLIASTGACEGSAVALLGVGRGRLTTPIRIGDTVHTRVTILATGVTGRGDAGVVQRRFRLFNQDRELTPEGRLEVLVKTRAAGRVA